MKTQLSHTKASVRIVCCIVIYTGQNIHSIQLLQLTTETKQLARLELKNKKNYRQAVVDTYRVTKRESFSVTHLTVTLF